ncbi:MAG TPA: NINE protein [Fimbriimonadaceae bacterium]|jgi:TM2 domain-containing membrane protein YozV
MFSVIAQDGKTYGPVDVATLKDWCIQGRVTPDTNVIDGISGRTMRAADLQDLYGIFPGPPQIVQGQSQGSPYGQPPAGSPYGYQQPTPFANSYSQPPTSYSSISPYMPKSKIAAALFAIFLGGLGIHRFYLGYTTIGVAMLLMFLFGWVLLFIPNIVVAIWALIDFVMILTGGLPDAQGQPLTA